MVIAYGEDASSPEFFVRKDHSTSDAATILEGTYYDEGWQKKKKETTWAI